MVGVLTIIEKPYPLQNETCFRLNKVRKNKIWHWNTFLFWSQMITKTLPHLNNSKIETKTWVTKNWLWRIVQNLHPSNRFNLNFRDDNLGFPVCFYHQCKKASTEGCSRNKCSLVLKDCCLSQTYFPRLQLCI